MVIEIRIESEESRVTVSIKGAGSSDTADLGAVAKSVTVGSAAPAAGGAPAVPMGTAGTGSGAGSGVVVVGPIVIGGSSQAADRGEKPDSPTVPIWTGGVMWPGGATGVVVIGPIVVCGAGVSNTATTQEIPAA
jgi:hypothetical protein